MRAYGRTDFVMLQESGLGTKHLGARVRFGFSLMI